MSKSITIHWEMQQPPVEAKEFIKIPEQLHSFEDILQWAFQNRLSRFQGFDIEHLSDEQKRLTSSVAAVFKRGVSVKNGEVVGSKTAKGSYPINFSNCEAEISRLISDTNQLILVDSNCYSMWPQLFKNIPCEVVETSEHKKTLAQARQLMTTIKNKGFEQVTVVGGGVLGDTAGFAAHMANVCFSFVPTTLLSMVDACVGGKTGVNYPPFGKNQVGAFAFPEAVSINSKWLESLPERHVTAGLAECYKHYLLSGEENIKQALMEFSKFKRLASLDMILPTLVQVKADVVSKDPGESGYRAILNLGHTLAHALEALSHAQQKTDYLLHGEAVGLGLCFVVILSEELGYMNPNASATQLDALKLLGLAPKKAKFTKLLGVKSLNSPDLFEKILAYMQQDKKATSHRDDIGFILLEHPGKVVENPVDRNSITVKASPEKLSIAWQRFCDFILSA